MWSWRSSKRYRRCSYIFIRLHLLHVLFANVARVLECLRNRERVFVCFHFWKNNLSPTPPVGITPGGIIFLVNTLTDICARVLQNLWTFLVCLTEWLWKCKFCVWCPRFLTLIRFAFWHLCLLDNYTDAFVVYFRVLCSCISKEIFTRTFFFHVCANILHDFYFYVVLTTCIVQSDRK